jgi:hypothetical protein
VVQASRSRSRSISGGRRKGNSAPMTGVFKQSLEKTTRGEGAVCALAPLVPAVQETSAA